MQNTDEIFNIIKNMIKPEYLENCVFWLKKNASNYDSIVVSSKKTVYRNTDTGELLFARISFKGKFPYISFSEKYRDLFIENQIGLTNSKTDHKFFKISLNIFDMQSEEYKRLPLIFNLIFIDVFSCPAFGCCSKYVECSNARYCIHDDLAYATACQYRKNLEKGKIFYGLNKNI